MAGSRIVDNEATLPATDTRGVRLIRINVHLRSELFVHPDACVAVYESLRSGNANIHLISIIQLQSSRLFWVKMDMAFHADQRIIEKDRSLGSDESAWRTGSLVHGG
jgi:hypothetical protein